MIRLATFCGLALALTGTALAQDKKDEKKEVPKGLVPLQGKWKARAWTTDGQENRIVAPDYQFSFDGDEMRSSTTGGKDGWAIEGTVTVDTKKKPAEFTLERNGKKTLGIYKIEGTKLHWATSPGMGVRPKTFTDKNVSIWVFEKAKPEKK